MQWAAFPLCPGERGPRACGPEGTYTWLPRAGVSRHAMTSVPEITRILARIQEWIDGHRQAMGRV